MEPRLYKIKPGGDGIIPAPTMVISKGQKVPVSEEFLRKIGYVPLLEVPLPDVPAGKTLVTRYEYVLDDVLMDPPPYIPEQARLKYPKRYGKRPVSVRPVYEVIEPPPPSPPPPPPPPPPRRFSKLKAVIALTEAGLWAKVKAYIEVAGLYDLYLAANEFMEDDPYFVKGLTELKAQLGVDDALIEEILTKSEATI